MEISRLKAEIASLKEDMSGRTEFENFEQRVAKLEIEQPSASNPDVKIRLVTP